MYPGPDELELSNPAIVHDIKQFLLNGEDRPSTVELTLRLDLGEKRLETVVNLPGEYPSSALPDIYIRF